MLLSLCLHNHQPAGNFPEVMERAFSDCYMPLLRTISSHSGIRLALHHSGCLLDWLESAHPEYMELLAGLVSSGRIEPVSGGYYEPVLPIFPAGGVRSQIRDMNDRLAALGARPSGLWLTERVWEPSIPSLLDGTGLSYAVVDDLHLRLAGVPETLSCGPATTEDSGCGLRLLGSSRRLRYSIPFAPPGEVLAALSGMSSRGFRHAFYGDDGEKFGVWPGTARRCFREGWLDEFLTALESSPDLRLATPGEAVSELDAPGPFFVPAASYPEMGEWALAPEDRLSFQASRSAAAQAGVGEPDQFVRGGFWRNFLTRYPESNELHKRILQIEPAVVACGSPEALAHLRRSQCNCAYWHGIFGGIYLPHLREALWVELHEAERLALPGSPPFVRTADMDFDGAPETTMVSSTMSLCARHGDGLALGGLALLPAGRPAVPLCHVLTRRAESYHARVSDTPAPPGEGTIHGDMGAVTAGLASRIVVDPHRRLCLRDLAFTGEAGDWMSCAGLAEVAGPVRADVAASASRVVLSGRTACGSTPVRRVLSLDMQRPHLESLSEYAPAGQVRCGMELCFNMLTGGEPDRFVSMDGSTVRTGLAATGRCRVLEVVDLWRRVRVLIESEDLLDAWQMPLDSVNRSERGYESVHQGVSVLLSRTSCRPFEIALRMTLEDLA
jgi:alpha-amylase